MLAQLLPPALDGFAQPEVLVAVGALVAALAKLWSERQQRDASAEATRLGGDAGIVNAAGGLVGSSAEVLTALLTRVEHLEGALEVERSERSRVERELAAMREDLIRRDERLERFEEAKLQLVEEQVARRRADLENRGWRRAFRWLRDEVAEAGDPEFGRAVATAREMVDQELRAADEVEL